MSNYARVADSSSKIEQNEAPSNGSLSSVTKRLQTELRNLMMNGPKGVTAFPEGDSIFHWVGTIQGPNDTVFEGFTFKLTLQFINGYPFSPPVVKMTTPCFHPNIDTAGNICLDILKDSWSALFDVTTILLSLQSLLGDPNINSPLNSLAAAMWSNQKQYRKYLLENFGNNKK